MSLLLLRPAPYTRPVVPFDTGGHALFTPEEQQLLCHQVWPGTTVTLDQTNCHARGVVLTLNVTDNPGGMETLGIGIQLKDGASGEYVSYAAWDDALMAANGVRFLVCYPEAIATTGGAQVGVSNVLPLPRTWRAIVTHSGSGEWTYSLGAMLLP